MEKKIIIQIEIDANLRDNSKENDLIKHIIGCFKRENNKTESWCFDFRWKLSETSPKLIKVK